MSRTVVMVMLVAMALVAVAAGEAEAHWTISGGKLVYHSVTCNIQFKQASNQPAKAECTMEISNAETLCRNNGGQFAPGQVPNLVVSAQVGIPTANINKKNGVATAVITAVPQCLTTPAEPGDPCLLGVTSEVEGACPNAQNWDVVGLIVRETTTFFKGFKCLDELCTSSIQTSESKQVCTLPANIGFETIVPPEGFNYHCVQEYNFHLN